MSKSLAEQTIQAAIGVQEVGRLASASIALTAAQTGFLTANDLGQLTAAGDYFFDFYTGGLDSVEVQVKANQVAGTVTPSVYSTYADGSTSKTVSTPAGAGLVAGVLQTLVLTGLRGVKIVRCKLTVAAASSVTFAKASGGLLEMNGL